MKRKPRTPLGLYAELEAERFSRSEFHELIAIWFPRTAAFATMRGGSVRALIPDDPQMDAVGAFYVQLSYVGKRRWDAYFNGEGTYRERALSVGVSKSTLFDWKDALMEKLGAKLGELNGETGVARPVQQCNAQVRMNRCD